MKSHDELIPFINERVDVRFEDGHVASGVLRVWQMQGPREYPFILEDPEAQESIWRKHPRFFPREVAEIRITERTAATAERR
jgi:hypothetical protein